MVNEWTRDDLIRSLCLAEAAEARTAVTREDVEKVVHGSGGGFFDERLDAITDAVCALFGIETEVDPLLDKAQEFAALADWELTDREAGLLYMVAAHVLGQDDRHVDQ